MTMMIMSKIMIMKIINKMRIMTVNLVIINGDDDDDDEDDDSSEDKENDDRSGDDNNDDEIIETFPFYPLFIPLNSYLLFFESPRELWSQTREAGRRPLDRRHCESKD